MTGRTHDLAGFTCLTVLVATQNLPYLSVATLVTSIFANQLGALFPDLDQAASSGWERFRGGRYLGKLLAPLAGGHRHITHSLGGLAIFGFLSYQAFQALGNVILVDMNIVWIAFIVGFISHLIMDSATDMGLPLLWPIKWRFGFPPLEALRPTTNGWVEKLFIFPGLLVFNFYLIYAHYDKFLQFFKESVSR